MMNIQYILSYTLYTAILDIRYLHYTYTIHTYIQLWWINSIYIHYIYRYTYTLYIQLDEGEISIWILDEKQQKHRKCIMIFRCLSFFLFITNPRMGMFRKNRDNLKLPVSLSAFWEIENCESWYFQTNVGFNLGCAFFKFYWHS